VSSGKRSCAKKAESSPQWQDLRKDSCQSQKTSASKGTGGFRDGKIKEDAKEGIILLKKKNKNKNKKRKRLYLPTTQSIIEH